MFERCIIYMYFDHRFSRHTVNCNNVFTIIDKYLFNMRCEIVNRNTVFSFEFLTHCQYNNQ